MFTSAVATSSSSSIPSIPQTLASDQPTLMELRVAQIAIQNPALKPLYNAADVCHLPEAITWTDRIAVITELPKEIAALIVAMDELSEWIERDDPDFQEPRQHLITALQATGLTTAERQDRLAPSILETIREYLILSVLTRREMNLVETAAATWLNQEFKAGQGTPPQIAALLTTNGEEQTAQQMRVCTPRELGTLRQMAQILQLRILVEINISRMPLKTAQALEVACTKVLLPYIRPEATQVSTSSSSSSGFARTITARPFPDFDALAPAYRDTLAQEYLGTSFPLTKPKTGFTVEVVS